MRDRLGGILRDNQIRMERFFERWDRRMDQHERRMELAIQGAETEIRLSREARGG